MQSSSRQARGGDETEFEHVLLNGACAETPSRSQLIEKVVWGKTQACQAKGRCGVCLEQCIPGLAGIPGLVSSDTSASIFCHRHIYLCIRHD